MMRKLWLLFILLSFKLSSQTYSIKGKVMNESSNPLENATVTLIKQKDSSLINFIRTSKSGSFEIKIPKQNEASLLQISGDKVRSYSRKFETINKDEELGIILLKKELTTEIEEVKITASPVKYKKDTVEYNASYLKVKPDSKIDELLKEIPGAEIDADGKMTVNGKSVNKIHINGKPLFDKNGKTELETIPADVIRKIQVTTSKTKEEELTHRAPRTDSLTVNFEMDEKNKKGKLTNLRLGYGSDNRFDGALFFTRIKKDARFSIVAGSNNINAGMSGKPSFGRGIFKTSMINMTYSNQFDKLDLEKLSGNYYERNTETYAKTSRTTYLPDYKLDRNSERSGNTDLKRLGFNANATLKLNQSTSLIFSNNFTNSTTESSQNNLSSTFRDDVLLNSSSGNVRQKSINNIFSQELGVVKNFQKEGRNLTASVSGNFTENSVTDSNLTTTIFHQSPEKNDYRNQRSLSKNQSSNFSVNLKYNEPISDSAVVYTEIHYNSKSLNNGRNVNDFNTLTEEYSNYNALLSNSINQDVKALNTLIGYDLNKTKYRFFVTANLEINDNDFHSVFNNKAVNFRRNFVFPNYETKFTYKFTTSKSLDISNKSDFTAPTMTSLNPYIDISDPLVSSQGKSDLKSTWRNSSFINFTNRNQPRNIIYSAKLKFDYTNNTISNFSFYDSSGKEFRTYANVSGNKNVGFESRFSKSYKWNKNEFRLSPSFFSNYTYRKGFVDGVQFTNTVYNFSPRIILKLNLREILDVNSSYGINYNFSDYTNYRVDKTRATQQNFSFGIVNYFLKSNLYFSNDINITKNNNISADFNRTSYFWSAGVNYKFYKKQMTVRFNINDILNQRQNAIRTIGDNYIEDKEELILKRYFMLSLLMNLNKFGGKKS